VRKERKEWYEDNSGWHNYNEWYDDRRRWAIGTAVTASAFRSLSCASSTVVVNGVTYYNCDNTWYNRAYRGGNVTYIVVNAPQQ